MDAVGGIPTKEDRSVADAFGIGDRAAERGERNIREGREFLRREFLFQAPSPDPPAIPELGFFERKTYLLRETAGAIAGEHDMRQPLHHFTRQRGNR